MSYKRSNSQYGMRGHIHEERSSAAASRQRKPVERKPVSPQVLEVMGAQDLYFAAKSAAQRGEGAYPRMADYCQILNGEMVATEMARKLLAEMVAA